MSHETTAWYHRALQAFRNRVLRSQDGAQPATIITDQEAALAAAIAQVFLQSKHLLCQWHLRKVMVIKKGPQINRGLLGIFLEEWSNRVMHAGDRSEALSGQIWLEMR